MKISAHKNKPSDRSGGSELKKKKGIKIMIKSKGIPYDVYRRTIDLFLLYEYCEWIMLGNKYEDGDAVMLDKYTKIAHRHVEEMSSKW